MDSNWEEEHLKYTKWCKSSFPTLHPCGKSGEGWISRCTCCLYGKFLTKDLLCRICLLYRIQWNLFVRPFYGNETSETTDQARSVHGLYNLNVHSSSAHTSEYNGPSFTFSMPSSCSPCSHETFLVQLSLIIVLKVAISGVNFCIHIWM